MDNSVLQMSHDDRDVLDTLGISEDMLLAGKVFKFTVIDAFMGDGSVDQLTIEALKMEASDYQVMLSSDNHGISTPSVMKELKYDIFEKLKNLDK